MFGLHENDIVNPLYNSAHFNRKILSIVILICTEWLYNIAQNGYIILFKIRIFETDVEIPDIAMLSI